MTLHQKICLASDNCTSVHPVVMESIVEANQGYASAYGADDWTTQSEKLIQAIFPGVLKVLFLPNGTGTNVLALKLACKRFESVICTDMAHIQYQESGATEAIVGCKLLTIPHRGGKAMPGDVYKKLKTEKAFGKPELTDSLPIFQKFRC